MQLGCGWMNSICMITWVARWSRIRRSIVCPKCEISQALGDQNSYQMHLVTTPPCKLDLDRDKKKGFLANTWLMDPLAYPKHRKYFNRADKRFTSQQRCWPSFFILEASALASLHSRVRKDLCLKLFWWLMRDPERYLRPMRTSW